MIHDSMHSVVAILDVQRHFLRKITESKIYEKQKRVSQDPLITFRSIAGPEMDVTGQPRVGML